LLMLAQSEWIPAAVFLLAAGIATDVKTGPTFAAVQNLAPPRMRATAVAVFMLGATVVGSSVGPLATGVLSDHFANLAFAGGNFAQACVGGAFAELEECRAASSEG